ncbi:MBL fold metallo-hydrolase [Sulfolobales archaeon HS-7]|nr:MBL fold metallo-hydrolase [Sulfolobales archaeon HS-7]
MKIRFLGTGSGASVGSRRFKSGVLIDNTILLDCGTGVNFRLDDLSLSTKVEVVMVSHLHIDHINGIPEVLVQRAVNKAPPLKIRSPPGFTSYFRSLKGIGNVINAEIIEDYLPTFKNDQLAIWSVKADHAIYGVAYVIDSYDKRIIYSGDTAEPVDEILEVAKDADLIIHESSCIDDCKQFGHTSIKEVLTLFSGKKVILTHIPAQLDHVMRTYVRENIILAEDMSEYEI